MYDVIFVGAIIGFFALCLAYIAACDRIIGSDSEIELDLGAESGDDGAPAPLAAPPVEQAA